MIRKKTIEEYNKQLLPEYWPLVEMVYDKKSFSKLKRNYREVLFITKDLDDFLEQRRQIAIKRILKSLPIEKLGAVKFRLGRRDLQLAKQLHRNVSLEELFSSGNQKQKNSNSDPANKLPKEVEQAEREENVGNRLS